MKIIKYITHSRIAIDIAIENGWIPGTRYTNLRDVKHLERIGFLDINWKKYDFVFHLEMTALLKPYLTIAKDIESIYDTEKILKQAEQLKKYAENVAIVPKDIKMSNKLEELIPNEFYFAYSVPTKYGGTSIPTECFLRPVHLLGGRPEVQRELGNKMKVVSLDCNRFTFDALYGDYFDGQIFRPHPFGGYLNCIRDSIININKLWDDYEVQYI